MRSLNVADGLVHSVKNALSATLEKNSLPKQPQAASAVEKFISPTAAQEKNGLSADLQKVLSNRLLHFTGDKNNPPKPPAYPNAPLFSEGFHEADDNLPTTDAKGNRIKDGDGVHYNDVKQGSQNNCFLMSAIASLAKNNPQAIHDMIKENRDDKGNVTSYTVSLYKKGGGFLGFGESYQKTEVNVPASDLLKNGAGQADNGEVWVKVIEAAYAKLNGGTDVWKRGGSHAQALGTLTGRDSTSHNIGNYSFESLQKDINSGKNVIFGTKSKEEDGKSKVKNSPYGLYNWHAYTVEKVYVDPNGKKMVQLYNPWGNDHPKPIPYEEFSKYFNSASVN